ncbi:MAG: excinuclease ABC subunit UvrC [Deltaproteobacteria bacterium]|nr:excinuclease ABC subunit UvrC [Deltaproteobacteria bacterium]
MRQPRSAQRDWLEVTKDLPLEPGVYLMKDRQDRIIYVGKAKSLRSRVRSYFTDGSSDYRAFVFSLGDVLGDIETLVTHSEKEALLLERELIKKHEPRFNVIWRDDKQYLCLRVDPSHELPRVEVVRNLGKDGARYFGPYHSATAARQTLRVANRFFQLRTCRDSTLYNRKRPCLEYQIGRCPAPCVLEIDRADYARNVEDVLLFLEGKGEALVRRLEERMWTAAETEAFEAAARLRDQIGAVKKTLEPQHVALATLRDQDVVGHHRFAEDICVAVISVRAGRMTNVDSHVFEALGFDDGAQLESFLLQYYAERTELPEEVVVPMELEGADALAELLGERRGKKVSVVWPRRGERARVLELAEENARHAYEERQKKRDRIENVLDGLKKKLHLGRLPVTMECFDISHFQGGIIVGSKVRFRDGQPEKKGYRRYRLRLGEAQDDFASMYEVLTRRVRQGLEDGDLPELFVIDGGKGQLNAARAAIDDAGARDVQLVSLAKSRFGGETLEGELKRSPERVFLVGKKDPIVLRAASGEVLLLARIRDEAHRFAITYQRKLRTDRGLASALDEVEGIGPKRKRALLRELGSVEKLRTSTVEELTKIKGISASIAQRLVAKLSGESTERAPREPSRSMEGSPPAPKLRSLTEAQKGSDASSENE